MKSARFLKELPPDPELLALKAELRLAQEDLAAAYHRFNRASDPDLVESCVYQINAEMARCNYLLRAIKKHDPEAIAALGKGSPLWV